MRRKKERNLLEAGQRTKNLPNLCVTLALDQDELFNGNPTIADIAQKYFIFLSFPYFFYSRREIYFVHIYGTFIKAENEKRKAFAEIECKYGKLPVSFA